eukprot:GHVN01080730.1.p1 GENE.GHVN01080730.1~~GHVN01080730.1.p1  ORF type:complete len:255 (+),score=4.88 GHVN01080730.1:360-1124(+)
MAICCCNSDQIETFIVIGATTIITLILWRSVIFAPIKLVAVFLHEFSHASACWMTGGKVTGISINEMFGGVTYSRGGSRCFTLWAGYIGSCIWGAFFILMTFHLIATRIAASVFIIACVATAIILRIEKKKCWGCSCTLGLFLRLAVIGVALVVVGCWVLEELYVNDDDFPVHPLRWCLLAIGTICTLHALNDTLTDVVCNKVNNAEQGKSDAVMFAEEYGGAARCWGLIWAFIAVAAVSLSLFGLIVLQSSCV